MNALVAIAAGFGILTGLIAVLSYVTKPLRKLVDDLGPLTERNSDGQSVFDEVRSQQKADGITLKNLAEEFPKNGVPTRSTVDAISRAVIALETKQLGIISDLADVRTAQSAHVQFHLEGGNPSKPKETD